jgi:hypothetical protein
MRKDKIFELRIDEEDEVSGIDSISLVDEPAIEINWVAFKKEQQEDFHVPDGEDEHYLNRIFSKGQSEQELLDEGWEVENIEEIGSHNFAGLQTTPNDDSAIDTDFYRVRFKYGLSPNISQNPIIPTTREYCRVLINRNYVFRLEDILFLNPNSDPEDGGFGGAPQFYRGGFNCRHKWFRILYKKSGEIINKSSININKIKDDAGRSAQLTPEWSQPSLVTTATRNNPSPSTVKNLGLSKEKFENMVIFGFKPRYFHMCPGAIELFKHLVSMEMDEETIGMVRSAAQVADNVFRIEEEVIKSELATPDQLMEAYILVEDFKDIIHEIDEEVGMIHDVSFMDGHIEKIKGYVKEDLGYDVGGLPSYVDQVETGITKNNFETYNDYPEAAKNNACKVLKWRDEHGDEVKGMTRVGWTRANQLCSGENISEETIARMAAFARHRKNAEVSPEFKSTPWKDKGYVAWLGWGGTTGVEWASRKLESIRKKKMSKEKFEVENEEQRTIVGVAMVPDKLIYRKDKRGNPYYVTFRKEEIAKIMRKYMKNKYTDNNDLDHNGKAVKDIYVIESWIVEDEQYDKSRKYGFSVPVGSWMVTMKVSETPEGDLVWERIKEGSLRGYSVSGWFEEIEQFSREEMFLKEVAKILTNLK